MNANTLKPLFVLSIVGGTIMPLAEEELLRQLLDKSFKVNYPPGLYQKDVRPDSPIEPPFKFYDLHIGSNHSLQRVVLLPSIPHLLSKICDSTVQEFLANGHAISSQVFERCLDMAQARFSDARSVNVFYNIHIGAISRAYLFKLCVNPDSETGNSPFSYTSHIVNEPKSFYISKAYLTLYEDHSGGIHLDDELKEGLSQSTEYELLALLKRFPRLAMWYHFPMVDTFTTMLQNIAPDIRSWGRESRTAGYRFITQTIPPPDSQMLAEKLNGALGTTGKGLSVRRSTSNRKSIARVKKTISPPFATERNRYRPSLRHYLEHAWAQAAIHDTTFMTFQCGRYERIGIRHRASQTLYLSEVIDTVNIKDPHYQKIHVGLHIAIYQDALERTRSQDIVQQKLGSKGKKRGSDSLEYQDILRSKKRRRAGDAMVPTYIPSNIGKHLVDRKLALVSLDYDALSSSVPSSFIRIGESCKRISSREETDWTKDAFEQNKFESKEYFTLTLLAPLGNGAIGTAHSALAEVKLESGEVLRERLVFKLAFTEKNQEKLRNEFDIYCHMSRVDGIEGILDVHGLFYDAESKTMGLLMADGGNSLQKREMGRTGSYADKVTTTPKEREVFRRIVESLRLAKVFHNDIRADNLTIDSNGNAFITDFDSAEYRYPDDIAMKEDMRCLNAMFEGKSRYDS
ncbi:hypothetical protein JR316_0001344 [Psilocybe cubensis]|uniref:Uncharacterized protein n=2 Tax=Psilocybe cubensis TaxID=181762 RepID=A0ACB8HHT8_PSICU|nr:hypothetical protein JR316_0001344 [Psilocybe cubensis]KAH9487274.1 hypothetical protein JR316_0001344 [Psilocybe cubensis]